MQRKRSFYKKIKSRARRQGIRGLTALGNLNTKILKKLQNGNGAFRGTNRQRSKPRHQDGGLYIPNRYKKQKGGALGRGLALGMGLPIITGLLGRNKKLGF